MSKRPSRVLIDMDGGIDDALALILALRSPELEVAGITAVSGNVAVEQAATNALRVVELLDRKDVWVAKGLANPLIRDAVRATRFHGKDGLGDSNLPLPKLQPDPKSALDLILEEAEMGKRRGLTIIATGPLTNIAAAFTSNPDLAGRIGQLVIMGGAYGLTEFGIGNETPVAEFNIYSDPEAAKIVFESKVSLKAVGLDVTMIPETHFNRKDYAEIKAATAKVPGFVSIILTRAMRTWGGFALHDPMAVAVEVRPSMFTFETHHLTVETKGQQTLGMTVVDRRDCFPENRRLGRIVQVCRAVKSRNFKRLFLASIMK